MTPPLRNEPVFGNEDMDSEPPPFSEVANGHSYNLGMSSTSSSCNTTPARLSEAPPTRASFTVAGKDLTTPLVSVVDVKAHLKVLSAFYQLKQDLIAHKQPELEEAGITDEDRWTIFLVKAHHRFEIWLTSRTCKPETCKLAKVP